MKIALCIALLTFLGIVFSQTQEERRKFTEFYCGNVCPQHLPSEHCQDKCRMMQRQFTPQQRQQMVNYYCGNTCAQHLSQEYCQRACQKHRRAAQREQQEGHSLEAEVLQGEDESRIRRIMEYYCGRECKRHLPQDHCRDMCRRYRRRRDREREHEREREREPVDRGEHRLQVESQVDVLEADDIELML